jgi:hypothetical protein
MTTLPLRAAPIPNVSHDWLVFARVILFFSAVLDVLAEARTLSLAAQAAYPRAEW